MIKASTRHILPHGRKTQHRDEEDDMYRTCLMLLAALGLACVTMEAGAQTFPLRPITMVVPFAAGAPVDTVGRLIAERRRGPLGQPIVLENVSGAAGSLGVGRGARAAADGYTISLGNISSHVLNGAVYTLQFDVLKDFEPVALLASNPQLIISKNAVPASDLKGLIAWLKANPDKASAGTGGLGGGRKRCHSRALLSTNTYASSRRYVDCSI